MTLQELIKKLQELEKMCGNYPADVKLVCCDKSKIGILSDVGDIRMEADRMGAWVEIFVKER